MPHRISLEWIRIKGKRGRLIQKAFRSRILVTGILAAFLVLMAPVREFTQGKAPAAGGSRVGFIV